MSVYAELRAWSTWPWSHVSSHLILFFHISNLWFNRDIVFFNEHILHKGEGTSVVTKSSLLSTEHSLSSFWEEPSSLWWTIFVLKLTLLLAISDQRPWDTGTFIFSPWVIFPLSGMSKPLLVPGCCLCHLPCTWHCAQPRAAVSRALPSTFLKHWINSKRKRFLLQLQHMRKWCQLYQWWVFCLPCWNCLSSCAYP